MSDPARVACPDCHSPAELAFRIGDRNRRISEDLFSYYRCSTCGLLFVSPIPDDLGRYYPDSYHGGSFSLADLRKQLQHEQFKIDLVRQFCTSGRLLEIGPSWGAFCLLAKDAGFDVDAIEMDPRCCEFLSETLKVRVFESSDPASVLESQRGYDVIALWQNLEHLPEPHRTIDMAAASLSPGGVLVIATPNPDSFQFRLFGRFWTHVDAPRHLFLIPIALIRAWKEKAGLETRLVTTLDAGSLGWNWFGWRESLAGFFQSAFLRELGRLVGSVLVILLRPIERREWRGTSYTVVFQKPDVR